MNEIRDRCVNTRQYDEHTSLITIFSNTIIKVISHHTGYSLIPKRQTCVVKNVFVKIKKKTIYHQYC